MKSYRFQKTLTLIFALATATLALLVGSANYAYSSPKIPCECNIQLPLNLIHHWETDRSNYSQEGCKKIENDLREKLASSHPQKTIRCEYVDRARSPFGPLTAGQ